MLNTLYKIKSKPLVKQSIVVVGIGSPFGADRLGWDIVVQLEQRHLHNHSHSDSLNQEFTLSFHIVNNPVTELLSIIENTQFTIIVDAIICEDSEEDLMRLEEQQIEAIDSSYSSHGFGVSQTLALGRSLKQSSDRVLLFGLNVKSDIQTLPPKNLQVALVNAVENEIETFIQSRVCDA